MNSPTSATVAAPRRAFFDITFRMRMTCLALFLGSVALFLINIGEPKGYVFDEVYYVNAAKRLVEGTGNTNWEHPPLGKYIIGASIKVEGDRGLGWRLPSALFGGISLVGMYFWSWAVFRRERYAVWVALAALFSQIFFVLARTGILDMMMFAFLVFGLAAVCAAWDDSLPPRTVTRLILFAVLMFALCSAIKWLGFVPWIFLLAIIGIIRLMQRYGARLFRFPNPRPDQPNDWYTPALWQGVHFTRLLPLLTVVPFLIYFVTFIPIAFMPGMDHGLRGIIALQRDILYGHMSVPAGSEISSPWYSWPLTRVPIWFANYPEPGAPEIVRPVGYIPNPFIVWGGFLAVFYAFWRWWRTRSRASFHAWVWYGLLYLCWAVIPRRVMFVYYYFPAAMALTLALAYGFIQIEERRGWRWPKWLFLALAAVMFGVFYPVLSGMRVPASIIP